MRAQADRQAARPPIRRGLSGGRQRGEGTSSQIMALHNIMRKLNMSSRNIKGEAEQQAVPEFARGCYFWKFGGKVVWEKSNFIFLLLICKHRQLGSIFFSIWF